MQSHIWHMGRERQKRKKVAAIGVGGKGRKYSGEPAK